MREFIDKAREKFGEIVKCVVQSLFEVRFYIIDRKTTQSHLIGKGKMFLECPSVQS